MTLALRVRGRSMPQQPFVLGPTRRPFSSNGMTSDFAVDLSSFTRRCFPGGSPFRQITPLAVNEASKEADHIFQPQEIPSMPGHQPAGANEALGVHC